MELATPVLKKAGGSAVTSGAPLQASYAPNITNPLLPRYGYTPDPMVTDLNGTYARMAKLLSTVPTLYSGAGRAGGGGGGSYGSASLPGYGGASGGSSSFRATAAPYTPPPVAPVLPAPAQTTLPQQQAAPTTPWGLQRQADVKPWQRLPSYRR